VNECWSGDVSYILGLRPEWNVALSFGFSFVFISVCLIFVVNYIRILNGGSGLGG
jgi:hypothetical protein